jgi:hypothetical protein
VLLVGGRCLSALLPNFAHRKGGVLRPFSRSGHDESQCQNRARVGVGASAPIHSPFAASFRQPRATVSSALDSLGNIT